MASNLENTTPLTLSKTRKILNYRFLIKDTLTLLHLMPMVTRADLPLLLGDHLRFSNDAAEFALKITNLVDIEDDADFFTLPWLHPSLGNQCDPVSAAKVRQTSLLHILLELIAVTATPLLLLFLFLLFFVVCRLRWLCRLRRLLPIRT